MSNQHPRKPKPEASPERPPRRPGPPERKRRSLGKLPRTHEQVLALSRTAAEVQSLLDPDRILETIGDELRDQGLRCFFCLLSDRGGEVVVRHTNLHPETQQAAEAMLGVPIRGYRFPSHASAHIEAVVRDGKATLDRDFSRVIAEIFPSSLTQQASQLAKFLQARRAISAPLTAGSDVLGILTVWSEHLTEADLPSVSVLAQQAAVALERADLYEDAMRRVFEMQALRETTLDMTRQLDLPQLLRLIVERAAGLVGTEGGALYLHRPERDELELVVSHNLATDYRGFCLKAGEGLSGKVAVTGEPLAVEEYSAWEGRSSKYDGARVGGVLAVPLKWRERIIGVLNVTDGAIPRSFSDRDLWILEWFASHAVVAIENARLFGERERKIHQLAALHEVSLELLKETDHAQLLLTIVRKATELLDAEAGAIDLYDAESQQLEMKYSYGYTKDYTGIRLSPGEGVAGRVCQTLQPMTVDDYANWPGRVPHVDRGEIISALGVPLLRGDGLLGVLTIDRSTPHPFDEEDIQLATLFANQAAVAMENAHLFAESDRTIRQLAALQDVSLEVVSKTDPTEVLPTIVRVAAQLLDAKAGAIDLLDPESQKLKLTTVYGYSPNLLGMKHALGEGVVGIVADTKEPLVVDSYGEWPGRSPQWERESIGTVLGVPLTQADQLLGVLTIDRPVAHPFDQSDLELATLFASQAAIAIQNARSAAATMQRVMELTTLREISLQLTQSLDLSTVLETIANSAIRLVEASDAHIFLYDEEKDQFVFGSGSWAPGYPGVLFKEVRKNGLTATVARGSEPVVINDARNHPLFRDEVDEARLMDAIAGFPLKRADKVLGVFNVAFMEPHTFDQDDLRVLTLLADQAAIAIENARLYQETDRRLRESQTLQEVSRLVNSSLEPGQIIRTVLETLAAALGYSMVSIYTSHDDGLHLGAEAGYDPSNPLEFIPMDKGVIGRVARRGQPELITNVRDDPDFIPAAPGVISEVAVPIKRDSEVLGVLNVESTSATPLAESDLHLLSSMAHQVSVAIQNAQLYQEAQRELAERKRAEEAYRAVVEHSLQGLAVVQGMHLVFANQAVADIAGYSIDELLALSPDEVQGTVHPDDREQVWGRLSDRLAGKSTTPHYEFRIIREDGRVVWVEMFANRVEYHGRPAVQAAIVDITERKRAEQALRESEERYRTLFEDSRDPVYITTKEGDFVDVNESFLDLFGVSRESLSQLDATELYAHPEDRDTFRSEIEKRGAVRDYELKLRKKDGTLMDTLLSTTLWRDTDGTLLGYRGIIRDITERKRGQEELQRSHGALTGALVGTVKALAALAEIRDPYTAGHQQRVAQLASAMAEEMGLSDDLIQGTRMAGLVHDIGKIRVPAEILSKPTELSDIETEMIGTHPQTAYDILSTVEFPWPVAAIVLEHHERLDGSGYPQGLVDNQILLEARILAVADVVEAMASDRPYRPAHGLDEALAEIADNAGLLYDAQAVKACLTLLRNNDFDLPYPRS
jgi:PAS domain S-box-containing protein/putative nucleotidyltransferase with HDIG domain